jgi:serine/threonine protein kinase/uncharacterized membrane protein
LTLSQVQGLGGGSPTTFADSRALARELVDRSWLTAYQANQLLQRRGGELLLGPYRLLDRLGEGGMGQVFKAYHVSMDRMVALKLIPRDRVSNPLAVSRFYQEVRAVAKLSHPNIVTAYDVGQVGETHFLAMEYVDGIDLAKLVQQSGRLPIPKVCEYIRQAALGLQHAHEKGLIHRDIKPGNLIVARPNPDEPPVIKILDFGLARIESESSQAERLTQLGNIVGTVDYIAPEQVVNARSANIRADIYSLGCSLFYLLTGQPPFPGETADDRLSARLAGKPESIRALRPEVPEGLAQVLGKMLARDPAKRFQAPAEVAAALEPFSKQGRVKAGTPDSVSGKPVAGDEGSGKIVAAAKKRPPQATPNPFATREKADKTSHKRSSPSLVVAKPKAKAAGNKGLTFGLAIGGGVAAVLLVVVAGLGFWAFSNRSGQDKGNPGKSDDKQVRVEPKDKDIVKPSDNRVVVLEEDNKKAKGKEKEKAVEIDQGTLIVEMDDPKLEVRVKVEGNLVQDRTTRRQFPLTAGKGEVELLDKDGIKLATRQFELVRGGKTTVKVTPQELADARAAEWVLSIGGIISIKEDGNERQTRTVADLPRGAFELTLVNLVSNPKVSDAGLAHLKDCKELTALYLRGTQVSDVGLAHLKDCKNLADLDLPNTQVSDAGLAHLKDCRNLTRLNLSRTHVSNAGLAHFKDCKDLTSLLLDGTKVSDAGLAHFKDCKKLTELSLRGTQVSDAGLAHFKDCKNLAYLFLQNTQVSDARLAHFKDCKDLKSLDLGGTKVSDAGLAHFKDCKDLKQLVLNNTQVSDAGLAHFKDCRNLTSLRLDNTKVSDAGLAHFKDCKDLTQLDLRGTKTSAAGVGELQKALPKCNIRVK